MSSALSTEVKDLISGNKVVIFSKTYCPYCKLAKEVFSKIKEDYKTVELDLRDDGEEIQGILGELTGARTVPRVFIKGNCVGGGSDVKALYEKGELQTLIILGEFASLDPKNLGMFKTASNDSAVYIYFK